LRAGSSAALVAALALTLALACGAHPARPPGPTTSATAVRAEVELAERAERARDHDGARRHYEAAITQASAANDAAALQEARRDYAETLISWGELRAAALQLERLVAAAPRDAAAWHDLGMVRHGEGDELGALAALATAKRLLPHDPRPRIALAALQWKLGQLDAAGREYRDLLTLDLSEHVRQKVRWALDVLAHRAPPPSAPTATPPAPTPPR
jgi:Flp pilus assembly protein TadD